MVEPSNPTGTLPPEATRPRRPRRHAPTLTALAAVTVLSACGHLWPVSTTPSPAAPQDTYACALSQTRGLGYKVFADTNRTGHREIEAQKELPASAKGPDPTEVSRRDVLSIRVTNPASGSGSTLRIQAGTLALQETRRGPTEVHEPANALVRADADTVLARCRLGSTPDSVARAAPPAAP